MKNLSVLALGLLVVACNGAGGGASDAEPKVVSGNVSAQEALTAFETNYKGLAESLEDEAVLRFNPCRDDLQWNKTGATTGTVEFSGVQFNAANVAGIVKNGDCDYTVQTGDNNGLSGYSFTPNAVVPMSGSYTTIQIVNGGSLSLRTDVTATSPSLMITETGAHASFGIADANAVLAKTLYRRILQADIQNSSSYALFEVDSTSAVVNFQHYNSNSTSALPLTESGSANFDQDAIPQIASTQLSMIAMSRYQNNGINFHYDTKGGVAFIMFDRHLDADEKSLMGCYALYLSTKTGSSELWEANYQTVCDL